MRRVISYTHCTELIYGSTKMRAESKLKEILSEIESSEDEFIIKQVGKKVETNKRRIYVYWYYQPTIGIRCSRAYVDMDVSIRVVEELIKPIMINYCRSFREDLILF